MSKVLSVILISGATLFCFRAFAQQGAKVAQIPIQQTSLSSGKQMYGAYCAACHGANGMGNGPAAKAMRVPPPDLVMLSRRNGGTYPALHVTSVLKHGSAHSAEEMPEWRELMLSLHKDSANPDAQVNLRIANLTEYLRSIQR